MDLLRINGLCEREVPTVDVESPDDRLAVLGEIPGNLVAHDRMRIGMRRAEKGRILERRKNLLPNFFRSPSLRRAEKSDRLLGVDKCDQFAPHVLVREPQRVARLVTDDAVILGLRSV